MLAACGSGSHGGTGSTIGPPDAPPDPTAQTIAVHVTTIANLQLFAFRDGPTAPWQKPAATAPGRYDIVVHGPYTVLDVCTFAPGFVETLEKSRTTDDPHDLDMPCEDETVPLSHITGSTTPLPVSATFTNVQVGNSVDATASDGKFDIQLPDGTYDLVARTASQAADEERIAIRRDLVVAGDTMVTPAIDFVAEGIATSALPITVTNAAAGEQLDTEAALVTPTAESFSSLLQAVHVLPDAALGPGDYQQIFVGAIRDTGGELSERRTIRRYTQTSSLTFTLPPGISAPYTMVAGRAVATWTTLPPYDRLEFTILGLAVNSSGIDARQITNLSASYIAATGATSAAFDIDVAGYDPAWRTEFDRGWVRQALSTRTDGDDVLDSFLQETIQP